VYVRRNSKEERTLVDSIIEKFMRLRIRYTVIDLCEKFRLYGHEYTYDASFAYDFFQNRELSNPLLPLVVAGNKMLSGPQEILRDLPYLQASYGDK